HGGAHPVPDEILLPVAISDAAARIEYLSENAGHRVGVITPQRGDKRRLVAMAQANAAQSFRARRDLEAQARAQVDELRRRLRLAKAPSHIECVDIATFQGGETVGALIAFRDGRPW